MKQTIWKWTKRVVLTIMGLITATVTTLAAIPAYQDPPLPEIAWGAGSSSVDPAYSGLMREFPPLNEPEDNLWSAEKAELGRLLFFDPILSQQNDLSCASCHHPDFGFADGLETAVGSRGRGFGPNRIGINRMTRNTPSLWNVGYNTHFFWDGRESSLEQQALEPISNENEMNSDLEQTVLELQRNSEYQALFAAAFGGGETAVSVENLGRALAAFERTLISNKSPFDYYAEGNVDALTPQQRRGLNLFRSGATRCFECHAAPTFATNTFRVIGVPSDDLGHADIPGAFKVPSLRNVALSAPYMHNGSLATLEDVLDFYAAGGGHQQNVANMDPFVNGFEMNEQERDDLIAFLHALTDESNMPEIPTAVPSGKPVVTHLANQARVTATRFNNELSDSGQPISHREPTTLTVRSGQSLQFVVDRARPGDTILIPYGIYYESFAFDTNNLTILGVPNDKGEYPIIDGEGKRADGIVGSGSNFEIGYIHIRNTTDNGIIVEGATNIHFHHLITENTGTYGIYPVQSSNVLIEDSKASKVNDAAIYAGQCENVIVRRTETFDSVIGIELENTVHGEIYDNHAHDNSLGLFVVLLPQLTSKVSFDTKVYNNLVENNNISNFAEPEMTVSFVPPGLGILIAASNEAEVYNNIIRGNRTAGIAIFNLDLAYKPEEIDVGHMPENNFLHDNEFENNGYDPDSYVAGLGIPTGDILWDATGYGNSFAEPDAEIVFPPVLPGPNWGTSARRVYWHVWNLLLKLL